MTQRNLSSTLTLIDRQQPLESKLLSAAKDPHGPNQASGAVGLDAAKYQELVAWVWQTCNGRTKVPPTLAPAEKAPQPSEQSPVLAAQVSREASVSSIPTTKPPTGAIPKKSRLLKQQAQPIVSAPGDFSSPPTEATQGQAAPSTSNVTPPN
jgi:hypothetical protein